MQELSKEKIMVNFGIPQAASDLVDFFLDEKEQKLIADFGDRVISEEDYPGDYLREEYHRGVVSKADSSGEKWILNDFYGFLDVFCVSRKEEYDRLSMAEKRRLDDWYFDTYYDRLDKSSGRPTPDRVLPLEEMLSAIEADPRPVYLNYCDCRMLTGECGHSTRTCITWKDGINSFTDRGLSTPISKEEALEIVRAADREGLMHTTMGMGLCNCCGDCCYLFRAQRRLGSIGVWPSAEYIAAFESEKCIGCGKCADRCHLSVFEVRTEEIGGRRRKEVIPDFKKCAGCGLCVNSCPAGALKLVPREI